MTEPVGSVLNRIEPNYSTPKMIETPRSPLSCRFAGSERQERGRKIVGGDTLGPTVWYIDPEEAGDDEDGRTIEHILTAILPIRYRKYFSMDALRVVATAGKIGDSTGLLRMRFSDDGGTTWSDYFDIDLTQDVDGLAVHLWTIR